MTAAGLFPLCPFSRGRLDASTCPGYAALALPTAPLWPGIHELLPAFACGNLRSEQGIRGFVPVCSLPAGLPVTAEALALLRPSPRGQSSPGTGKGVGGSVE
jgi:hypothetical protein